MNVVVFDHVRQAIGAQDEEIPFLDRLLVHLDVEDNDVLPLYWRHYTAEEYDAVFQKAVKKGKKTGLAFVVPWNVDCLEGAARDAFVAAAPPALRLVHRLVRPRYERLLTAAFGSEDPSLGPAYHPHP